MKFRFVNEICRKLFRIFAHRSNVQEAMNVVRTALNMSASGPSTVPSQPYQPYLESANAPAPTEASASSFAAQGWYPGSAPSQSPHVEVGQGDLMEMDEFPLPYAEEPVRYVASSRRVSMCSCGHRN